MSKTECKKMRMANSMSSPYATDVLTAALMKLDEVARGMELKWGVARLQRLVAADLAAARDDTGPRSAA